MGNLTSRIPILGYFFGPNVYRLHNNLPNQLGIPGQSYTPTALEENSQKIINLFSSTKTVLYYTLPIWSVMLYRRGYFTLAYGTDFFKYSAMFTFFYFGLLLIRGIGRMNNQEYIDFLSVLKTTDTGNIDKKRSYDFDFKRWSVDFQYNEGGEEKKNKVARPPYHLTGRLRKVLDGNSVANFIVRGLPCELLSYVIAHGFGLSMVYPGSTALLNMVIGTGLKDGRNKLVEQQEGKRAKLETKDGNYLDTMFINKRMEIKGQNSSEQLQEDTCNPGAILVICCEGNAGFYEVGIMVTPVELGYSVLGWNHPGFGSSTGSPSPTAEIDSIDTVMQYAINKLYFQPENIIIFGWSIGAYAAIHGAVMYPDVRGLFLDATFDDIVPLAIKAMPATFEGIVKRTIRGYINLQHGELIKQYKGPVHFVRRQMDEVMNRDGQRNVSSNCGNPLLYNFLLHRFPRLFGSTDEEKHLIKAALDSWLDRDDNVMRLSVSSHYEMEPEECEVFLKSYIQKHAAEYPVSIGEDLSLKDRQQLVLYLADKHMSHFESTHCTPLPTTMFVPPWNIKKDLDEVSIADEFEIVYGNNGK